MLEFNVPHAQQSLLPVNTEPSWGLSLLYLRFNYVTLGLDGHLK
jgi:hypothetical protein